MVLSVLLTHAPLSPAAEWQWSVPIRSIVSSETNDHPRAFLYIPPDCKLVRAIVVGQHNMQEEPILEHPVFRKTMAQLGFAQIWITPAMDMQFRYDQGRLHDFDRMLADLADASGYAELRTAPVVPMGHSAAASFPWFFAMAAPERTLAAISISGTYPSAHDGNSPPVDLKKLAGVPGLLTLGEYEWAHERWPQAAKDRVAEPLLPLSFLGCEADGHFASLDEKIEYLCLYLRKAAHYRLPANDSAPGDPVKLTPINPTKTGWLADHYRQNGGPVSPSAPVGQYKGDTSDAFWYFDEEIAHATTQFGAVHRGKKVPVVGFVQDGKLVVQNPKAHAQVQLKFLPDPVGDGLTFKLVGDFQTTVPEGRPEKWTGKKAGEPLDHPASRDQISIDRICGPAEKIDRDTWAIRFYRMGLSNPKRTNDIWFVMTHPGDGEFKRSVQQAQMRFPIRNDRGAEQTITFSPIADQVVGTESVPLKATSSAGATVRYYVREGPAELKGDALVLTQIPPRAKFPIAVTVVAWQWGRSIEPLLKTAEPVGRTFYITRAGDPAPAGTEATTPIRQPLLDVRFDARDPSIELAGGASLGEEKSGVSGMPADRAYTSGGETPVAKIRRRIAVDGLEQATFSIWYKPRETQGKDATLLNAGGLVLIRNGDGWTLRVEARSEKRVMYWFQLPGSEQEQWFKPDEWVFLAGVWKRANNEVIFYRGSTTERTRLVRRTSRDADVGGLVEHGDPQRRADTIGNSTRSEHDRPFNGSIDNVRLLAEALTKEQIEAIRKTDLAQKVGN